MDDPFDQNNSTLPSVDLIDADASGPDNRPSGEAPWSTSAVTDATGQAKVTFTVSMQPGNNYRTGASVIQGALNQNTEFAGVPVSPQEHADELNALSTQTDRFLS
ncbi:MAG: hypothetical protein AABZ47_14905 [Planctomycetota bacterium]